MIARGLPSAPVFLDSEQENEVRKLACELQSSSDPEESSTKGTLLICVALCKTDPFPLRLRLQSKLTPAALHSSSRCSAGSQHSLLGAHGRHHLARPPNRPLSLPDLPPASQPKALLRLMVWSIKELPHAS